MTAAATVKLEGGDWKITAPAHLMMRIKRVFGRANGKTPNSMKVRDTLEVCRDLAWVADRFPLEVDPADYLQARAALHKQRVAQVADLFGGRLAPRRFELAVPPREYQTLAAEAFLRRGSLLLADDVGLGKTASAICALTDPSTRPALVVTLTHLPTQWGREIKRFAPALRVHVIKSAKPYPLGFETPSQTALLRDGWDVIIINYHKLASWAEHLAGNVRTVVFDECQELRSGGSKKVPAKYEAASEIASLAQYRWGLSATPIYNYGGEFHSVLSVIDPDALGSRTEFFTEWCEGTWDKARIGDPVAFGSYLREQGIMLRRTRSDVGRELPAVSRFVQHVDADLDYLPKVQSSAIDLARAILSTGGTGFDRMRDASEFDMMVRRATGVAKAPHVADFVRLIVESGEPVVLFGWHHEVYAIWKERLADLGVVFFTGRESAAEKAAALDKFKAGEARVFVISLRAGAGLDGLQHASCTVVFGELDWSPGVMEQCTGRVDRDGQKRPVFQYVLLADMGSDPVVSDVLGLKRSQLDHVIDPDAKTFSKLEIDPDHVKKLAASYLAQLGVEEP